MTTRRSDSPGPADGDESGNRRRILPVLAAISASVMVLGLVAVLIAQSADKTDPLDSETTHVADFTMQPTGACRYEADRGGLVAHFDVSTSEAGRFTVDLKAVTKEGADNLDIPTTHVVRVTVPFYGGQTRKQFEVVVPLAKAEYQDGYQQCRYLINPTGAE